MDDRVVPPSMSYFVYRVLLGAIMHKLLYEGHYTYIYFSNECHKHIFGTFFGSPLGPLTPEVDQSPMKEDNEDMEESLSLCQAPPLPVQVTSGKLWPLSLPKRVLPRWFSQQPLVWHGAPFSTSPSRMYAKQRDPRGPSPRIVYNPVIPIENPTLISIAPPNPSVSYNPDPTIGISFTSTQMDMFPIIPVLKVSAYTIPLS
ncbi:hypothetical protein LguiB_031907 [Lonicera macranthoides]